MITSITTMRRALDQNVIISFNEQHASTSMPKLNSTIAVLDYELWSFINKDLRDVFEIIRSRVFKNCVEWYTQHRQYIEMLTTLYLFLSNTTILRSMGWVLSWHLRYRNIVYIPWYRLGFIKYMMLLNFVYIGIGYYDTFRIYRV